MRIQIQKCLIFILSLLCLAATPTSPGYVARFFAGSERQLETRGQCREIKRALSDALAGSAKALKSKRYGDYQGISGKWTLLELIEHYFVPAQPEKLSEAAFFADYRTAIARKAFKAQLEMLGSCSSYAGE
jgi:hypothetical protein